MSDAVAEVERETTRGSASGKLPPVAEIALVSVILMFIGGIYLAAQLPGHASVAAPVGLVIAGGVLTLADVAVLSRVRPFAWSAFFLVLRWALAAYAVIAGILIFVFVRDHTPATAMALLIASLVVFAVDVPTILAFTVARFQLPSEGET